MLPSYILNELLRRLSPERARVLAKSVKIDLNQPLPEAEPGFTTRYEFNGQLDFDLTIGALGHCISLPCRLSWTADLTDDEDRFTGEPIRVLGHAQQALHVLIPTREDEPVFEWTAIDHGLLPAAAIAKLDDQVEEHAKLLEASGPK